VNHFLDTVETIEPGAGFTTFGTVHLLWLAGFLLSTLFLVRAYRRADGEKRRRLRRLIAGLLLADELFKIVLLCAGGNYMPKYLPLHLCSINIIFIAIHAWRPSKLLDNFLYGVCIPAAAMALLFPSWTALPPANFMHIHSFTVHILLVIYPVMLTAGGDIRPEARQLPRCLLFLVVLAAPIYVVNLLFGTNFMFLMEEGTGNPLGWFEAHLGSHLIGIPVLASAALAVMYVPLLLKGRRRVMK